MVLTRAGMERSRRIGLIRAVINEKPEYLNQQNIKEFELMICCKFGCTLRLAKELISIARRSDGIA